MVFVNLIYFECSIDILVLEDQNFKLMYLNKQDYLRIFKKKRFKSYLNIEGNIEQ